MKVHFSASIERIDERIEIYRAIRDAIYSRGDVLARDWIEEAYLRRGSQYSDKEALDIMKLTRKAISDCELAIFEVTDRGFGVGYQAALVASLKKPVLLLQHQNSKPLGAIAKGTDIPLRDYTIYHSKEQAKSIVIKFIEKNDVATLNLRFNMVLERDLLYYLTNESEYTGVSKSQIVRNLIRRAAQGDGDLI